MATMPDDGLKGLRPVARRAPAGLMPNAAHQDPIGFMTGASYQLAIVEFDDQGRCYDRKQLDAVSSRVETLRETGEDVILLLFVHGWKHDARSDDPNLTAFREVLAHTVQHERDCSAEGHARPVMGIFVGWRGLSAYGVGDVVADATFWGRQEAARRIATGSVRELFGRLRHYRNSRLKHGGSPLLVIAGHSFGGMIVYSALAQSLIEAASAPAGHIIPGFADLVLLVNPAIEGARYLPIYDLVIGDAFNDRTREQLPIFICVQAENDQPVGTWFPLGNVKNRFEEAVIGDLERKCVTHAIGFIEQFRTHRLTGPGGGNPFVLDPPQSLQKNPYWVIRADKPVVDGHGGIWQAPFLRFLAAMLFQHVNVSRSAPGPQNASNSVAAAVASKIDAAAEPEQTSLADFACKIRPLRPDDENPLEDPKDPPPGD